MVLDQRRWTTEPIPKRRTGWKKPDTATLVSPQTIWEPPTTMDMHLGETGGNFQSSPAGLENLQVGKGEARDDWNTNPGTSYWQFDQQGNDVPGMLEPGNIDLNQRPPVQNPDGSVSTIRSASFGDDNGQETLIPTIVNGQPVDINAAVDEYDRTQQHLGKFLSPDTADSYAEALHQQEADRVKRAVDEYDQQQAASQPVQQDQKWNDYAGTQDRTPPETSQPVAGLNGLEDAGDWQAPRQSKPYTETNPLPALAQGADQMLSAAHEGVKGVVDNTRPLEAMNPVVGAVANATGIHTPSIGDVLQSQHDAAIQQWDQFQQTANAADLTRPQTDDEMDQQVQAALPIVMGMGAPLEKLPPLEQVLTPAGRALERSFDEPLQKAAPPILGLKDRIYKNLFDDLQLQKSLQDEAWTEAKKLGLSNVPPDLEWVNLLRRDPNLAAEVPVKNLLKPAFEGLDYNGPEYRYMRQIATNRNVVEVARAQGYKAFRDAMAEAQKVEPPAALGVDLQRARASVNSLTQHLDVARQDNDVAKIADLSGKLADAGVRLRQVNERMTVWQQDQARLVQGKAVAAWHNTEAFRKFSGGMNVQDAEEQLRVLEQRLPPAVWSDLNQRLDKVYAARDVLLRDRLVKAGIWTPETYNNFAQNYSHYLPTQILHHLGDGAGSYSSGQSHSVATNLIKSMTPEGTDAARLDPFAALVRAAYTAEKKAQDNEAFNAFQNIWRLSPTLQQSGASRAMQYTQEELAAMAKNDPNAARVARSAMTKVNQLADRPGWVKYEGYQDGRQVTFAMPEAFQDIIKSQSQSIYGNQWFHVPMRLFHEAVISRNPKFLIPAAAMDAITYGVRAAGRQDLGPLALPKVYAEYLRTFPDVFKGIMSGTFHGDTAQYLQQGGGFGMSKLGMPEGPQKMIFGKKPPEWLIPTPTSEAQKLVHELTKDNLLTIRNGTDLRDFILKGLTFKPLEHVSQRLEMVPRVAEYRNALKQGETPLNAVVRGRTVTLDFHQGGTLSKLASQYIPFFNVGMQGSRAMAQAFKENPAAFTAVMGSYIGGLELAADLWNHADPERQAAYESQPQYAKDAGPMFMLPHPTTDRLGQKQWQGVSVPLREYSPFHMWARAAIDKVRGENPRDWINLAANTMNNVSPVRANNPGDFWMNAIPIGFQTGAQMYQNWDAFRGQPIKTQQSRDQAGVLGKVVQTATGGKISAPMAEFAAQDLGGGYAGSLMGAANQLFGDARQKPDIGRPQSWPIAGGVIGRFVRPTSGIPSQQDVREQGAINLNVKDNPQLAQQMLDEWKSQNYDNTKTGIFATAPTTPHQTIMDELQKAAEQLRNKRDDLLKTMAPSQLDPAARKATLDQLYSSPARQAVLGTSVDLPKTADVSQAVQRYQAAQAVGVSPQEHQMAQTAVLNDLAKQWKVEPAVVRDAITAAIAGKTLAPLGISEPQMQDAMTRYLAPRANLNPDGTPIYEKPVRDANGQPVLDATGKPVQPQRDPKLFREAQRSEVVQLAKEYGVSADALLDRLQVRMQSPNTDPTERSMDNAFNLWGDIQDQTKFPKYVDPKTGQAWFTLPSEREVVDAKMAGISGPIHNPVLQSIRDAENYAKFKQLDWMTRQPDYKDYQAWFGPGKTMSPQDWERYTTGQIPRYTDTRDPYTADLRDLTQRAYALLPNGNPLKAQLRPKVIQYRRLSTNAWKTQIMQDEMLRNADDLSLLDELVQQRQP